MLKWDFLTTRNEEGKKISNRLESKYLQINLLSTVQALNLEYSRSSCNLAIKTKPKKKWVKNLGQTLEQWSSLGLGYHILDPYPRSELLVELQLLCFQQSYLLTHILGDSRWRLKYLGPCRPCEGLGWSSLAIGGIWAVNHRRQDLCLPLK